ncbi:hypothetical protein GCM10027268_06560 [Brachybacterium huguangmaarense]
MAGVPVTTQDPGGSGGTFHDLLSAFTTNDGTAFGRLRQILMITFGIGFLTAAGFVTATWRSGVRSGGSESRAGHGRRRRGSSALGRLFRS